MCRNGTIARPRWIMQGSVRLRMHVRGMVVGGIVQHGERHILGKGKRLKSGVGGDYV